MKIAVACYHAGFEFKNRLIEYLREKGHTPQDFGCQSSESCDYPDYAIPAVQSVVEGKNDRAILICSNGLGMCMVANKIDGIRGALVYNENTASMTRRHHDSNVLCLGAKEFSAEALLKFVEIWMTTDFEGGRHARRTAKFPKIQNC